MKYKLLLLLFLASLNYCSAQLDEQWCYRDSIPGSDMSIFNEILVDSAGNTYITGYELASKAMFLKKIDPFGTLLWNTNYIDSIGAWYYPSPSALLFSKTGNIQIVGNNYNKNIIFLNEYDTNGNLIFNQPLTDTSVYDNASTRKVVSDSSGNLYVCIVRSYTTTMGDPASTSTLAKYLPNGAPYPGFAPVLLVGGSDTEVKSISLDKDRNITVLTSELNYDDIDKYDSTGIPIFHFNCPFHDNNEGFVKSDQNGNTLFLYDGYSSGDSGIIYKMDTMANILWSFSFPAFLYSDMTIDASGNIYVTGQHVGFILVLKLSPSGVLLWSFDFQLSNHTTETGTAIKISPNGKLFVLGIKQLTPAATINTAIMLQLDTAGNYISSQLHTEQGNGMAFPFDFNFDSTGTSYVCGLGRHGIFRYPFVYKLCNDFCNGNITGRRYTDANSSCVLDSADVVMPSQVLLLKPDNIYATTNSSGYYHFKADSGSYVIKPILPLYWISACNKDSAIVTINSSNPGDTIDFGSLGFGALQVNDLQISYATNNIVRPGFSQSSTISYYNVGTTVISNAQIKLVLDPVVFSFSNAIPAADSVSGNSYFWNIGNIGIYGFGKINLQTSTPFNTPLNSIFINTVVISPYNSDSTQFNNSDTIRGIVRGSCDPNQKTQGNTRFDPQNPLAPNKNELAYHIDFQNTGTDTAFTVVVIDTLDKSLAISSLRFGASSHPYTWEVYGPGVIKFTFSSILLPDSNTNEVLSHGYLKYYISPKPGLQSNTIIYNTANIFFDFNSNVRTNTTAYPLLQTSNVLNGSNNSGEVLFYPNPVANTLYFRTNEPIKQVRIVNLSGQSLVDMLLSNKYEIDVSMLLEGFYFLELYSQKGILRSKFIKQ